MPNHAVDMRGVRYGRLTAIEPVGTDTRTGLIFWRCRCDCRNEVLVSGSQLRRGRIRSCGCLRRKAIIVPRSTAKFPPGKSAGKPIGALE